MSTRATYQFTHPDQDSITVYKHPDGYPEGALRWITNTVVDLVSYGEMVSDNLRYALYPETLAHAFMRANKEHGFMEITPSAEEHADTEYHYMVTSYFTVLVFGKTGSEKHPNTLLFEGTLAKATERWTNTNNNWAINP